MRGPAEASGAESLARGVVGTDNNQADEMGMKYVVDGTFTSGDLTLFQCRPSEGGQGRADQSVNGRAKEGHLSGRLQLVGHADAQAPSSRHADDKPHATTPYIGLFFVAASDS